MSQPELVAESGRRFAGFAAAVLVFIIDPEARRFLMLSSPEKRGRPGWEVVNGAVDAGESLQEAVEREVAEEVGSDVDLDVIGAVDAWSWRYDDLVRHMISIAFVAAYRGGEVVPEDDMAGSEARWMTLEEIRGLASQGSALIPDQMETFERALERVDAWVR